MPTRKRMTTLLAIAALLVGGLALAQARGRGGFDAALRPGAGLAGGPLLALHRGHPGALRLADLPIGTTVEVAFHDGDPAAGAAAVTTLDLTVGVDSESRFAADFAAAREQAADWEAAYLVVTTGEQTRTVTLADGDDDATGRLRAAHTLGWATAGMSDGDTVAVTLVAGDPDDGGTVLERLSFTYGVDSAIGFRSALQAAAEGADAAVVVTSPRTVTLDLGAVDARRADGRDRLAAHGAARGGVERDLAPGADGRILRRTMPPGRTR